MAPHNPPALELSLLLEVRIDAFDADGRFLFAPRFWYSDDLDAEQDRFRERLTLSKPWLERCVELAPESPEAARAKVLLQDL